MPLPFMLLIKFSKYSSPFVPKGRINKTKLKPPFYFYLT